MKDDAPRYCSACGDPLREKTVGDPPVTRLVCERCDRIVYRNPAVGVAVVATDGDRILLGRRGRGPYAGCIPCGYVEWDDDARSLLRAVYCNEADLLPDYVAGTLTVRLHHLASRSSDAAIRHLCDELTATEMVFPETNLRLIFELGSAGTPPDQEP
jgi:hypothetical protein